MTTTTIAAVLTHKPCCSSHGIDMTCERYRRSHFVEVGKCCSNWTGPDTPPPAPVPSAPICAPRHAATDALIVHPNADCPVRRTVALEAIQAAIDTQRQYAADAKTRDGGYEHANLADWLDDYKATL